jgi:hypothetical protein
MCNAAKHSPSCMCGFGPPYPPTYRVGHVTPWEEEVLDDPAVAKDRLRQAGYDDRSINAFATQLAEVRRSPAPSSTRVERVRELLGMRRRVVEKTWLELVDVPLYRFAAPNVKGAKVEYSEGSTTMDGSGWSVTFPGIGLGSTKAVEITKSRTFEAGAGEAKQVYVRVLVRIKHEAVYDGERLVGRGYTAEVASPSESGDPQLLRRGVRSVPWPTRRPDDGTLDSHDMVDLALSGDTTGATHKEKRSWVTDVSREVKINLAKAKLVDVSALATVKRTRRLELSFELPAGHDYQVYLCNGFTHWTSPRWRAGRSLGSSARRR